MLRTTFLWTLNILASLSLLGIGYGLCALYGLQLQFPELLKGGTLLFFASTLSSTHFMRYYINYHSHAPFVARCFAVVGVGLNLLFVATIYPVVVLTLLNKAPVSADVILISSMVSATVAICYSLGITVLISRIAGPPIIPGPMSTVRSSV